jgi:hypothetical protein
MHKMYCHGKISSVCGELFLLRVWNGGVCNYLLDAGSGHKVPNLRKSQIEIKYTHSLYIMYNCTKIHKLFY